MAALRAFEALAVLVAALGTVALSSAEFSCEGVSVPLCCGPRLGSLSGGKLWGPRRMMGCTVSGKNKAAAELYKRLRICKMTERRQS